MAEGAGMAAPDVGVFQPAAMVDADPNGLLGGHHLSVGTPMDMLGVALERLA